MPDPLFPVRKVERDPRQDFWATLRWGAVLAGGIWIVITVLERITSL
jgi:hypothetical protein